MVTEVCANSFESALNAQKGGASRIELCSELAVGGITPSYGLIKKVCKELKLPIHVLIRPRSGNFTYSDSEFEVMLSDIDLCRKAGCKGIVSGVLNKDLTIDTGRTKLLIREAGGMHFTFHRAFDWVLDPFIGLEQLEILGCDTLLTSGQAANVTLGSEKLIALNKRANNIVVMPGGGVNKTNISVFKNKGFKAVHFSASLRKKSLPKNPEVSMISPDFFDDTILSVSDEQTIREIVNLAAK